MTVNLTDPIFHDEDLARAYFEEIRWPNGPVCPHCGNANTARIYAIAANLTKKVRDGLRECQDCHGQFTVRTGGIMESSHLPLTKWALAYRLMASSKKGVSAHQLHRSLGVTYKTAWFLCHRIREAMRDVHEAPLGSDGGAVEVDETYVGGKPRKGAPGSNTEVGRHQRRNQAKMGRGTDKAPVVALVERDGRVIARHVADITAATLGPILREHISSKATLMTRLIPLSQVSRYVVSWARASGSGNGRDGDLQWRGREP
jgi:transposase-like protein